MAWYNRNKNNAVVLPELEKYYDAERRERSGLAWILALVSVAGIALVLIGVFFGGRWTYRHFKNDNKATVAVVQKDDTKTSTQESNNSADKSTESNATNNTSTPAPVTSPSTASPSVPTVATPSASGTGSSSSTAQLANTGPTSVVPAFVVSSFIGTLIYRRKLKA